MYGGADGPEGQAVEGRRRRLRIVGGWRKQGAQQEGQYGDARADDLGHAAKAGVGRSKHHNLHHEKNGRTGPEVEKSAPEEPMAPGFSLSGNGRRGASLRICESWRI